MKGIEPISGSFHPLSVPRFRGVEITKIAIAPERGVRSLRPFGQSFWYVLAMILRPPHPTASRFATVADLDVFWGHFCSCSRYVVSHRLTWHSHIPDINWSGMTPPACCLQLRGRSCTFFSARDSDPSPECLNRFTCVQVALGIIFPLIPKGFRVILRV